MKHHVAVIGAGPSGLACLKELLAERHTVVGFEAGDDIGGVFRPGADGGRAYEGMRLTSSNFVTAFSDLPPDEREPCHWTHGEYVDYLRRYADRFDLLRHVRFGTRVRRLARHGDGWRIESVGPDGAVEVEDFDAVAVCTGIVQRPHRPGFEGEQRFRGPIVHTADYRDAAPFAGKRVVVVGGGETGGDVINAIAAVAADCTVSLRRGLWIIPRRVRGVPNDFHTSRILHGLPRVMLDALSLARARALCAARRVPLLGRLVSARSALRARLLLDSGGGCFSQYAVKTEAMLEPIIDGRCRLAPAIERFEPDAVVFRDGTRTAADAVVLCTGYRVGFPFIEHLGATPDHLYRRVFDPSHGRRLAFIGFARPAIGAIPPLAEMQARWFALVCSGARDLPPPAVMHRAIAADREATRRRFGALAERLPTLVDYTPYLDDLALEIGCKPDLLALAAREPRLAWWLFVRPFVGAQFRLDGPHAAPDAARLALDRARPVTSPVFLAFLIACHGVSRVLAALGVEDMRPALSVRGAPRPAPTAPPPPPPGLGRRAGHAG